MIKLPGRVSGFSPSPAVPWHPRSIPTETASLPWWDFDRAQNSLLNAVPGQTWSGWDAGSFLAHTMHHGPHLPPLSLVPQNCYAKLSRQRCGSSFYTDVSKAYVVQSPVMRPEMSIWSESCRYLGWAARCKVFDSPGTWTTPLNTETHSVESGNSHFSSMSQITPDSCWSFSSPQRQWLQSTIPNKLLLHLGFFVIDEMHSNKWKTPIVMWNTHEDVSYVSKKCSCKGSALKLYNANAAAIKNRDTLLPSSVHKGVLHSV